MKKCFSLLLNAGLRIAFCIFLIFLSTLCYASAPDTFFVRLKTGGKLKGEIIFKSQDYFIINSKEAGEQKINWDEITLLTTADVYDSLKKNKSILILPAAKFQENVLKNILYTEFLIGKGFSQNRYFGIGLRAYLELFNYITLGAIVVYHLGTNEEYSPSGFGQLVYWGPEIGMRFNFGYLILEPSISLGDGTYFNKKYYIPSLKEFLISNSESKLYYAPAIGLKTDVGSIKLGFQYRHIIINNLETPSFFISIGY